jgi:hypothetical protein
MQSRGKANSGANQSQSDSRTLSNKPGKERHRNDVEGGELKHVTRTRDVVNAGDHAQQQHSNRGENTPERSDEWNFGDS